MKVLHRTTKDYFLLLPANTKRNENKIVYKSYVSNSADMLFGDPLEKKCPFNNFIYVQCILLQAKVI